MRNPNNISNPKTIRRYEREEAFRHELRQEIAKAEKQGYQFLTNRRGTDGVALNKDGKSTGLHFESHTSALDAIKRGKI